MKAGFGVGMIGIGVMDSNLLLNMANYGFGVIGYDIKQERVDKRCRRTGQVYLQRSIVLLYAGQRFIKQNLKPPD